MNSSRQRHQRCPQRLGSRGRHLLSKRCELFGLLGQRQKLLLCKLGRKFEELRRRFYARYSLGKIERGFGIGVSEFDQLVVVILYPFNCRRIAISNNVGRLAGGRTHFLNFVGCIHSLINFLGLCGALFNHFAELNVGFGLGYFGLGNGFPSRLGFGRSRDLSHGFALRLWPSDPLQPINDVSLERLSPLIYRNRSPLLLVGPVWIRKAAARNRVSKGDVTRTLRNVRYWHKADIGFCTAHVCL